MQIAGRLDAGGGLSNYQFQFGQVWPYTEELVDGLLVTLQLSAHAILFSLVLGVLGASARTQGGRIANFIVTAYVEIVRNTPFLVQAFFIYFGLPSLGIRLDPETAAAIALSLNGGAYLTEIIRAGINSIPCGQFEAGRALGLGRFQIYRYVVLLPALRAIFPAVTAEIIVIFLATSVCSAIAVDELTAVAISVDSQILRSFEVYTVLLGVYLALTIVLSVVLSVIERNFLSWGGSRRGRSLLSGAFRRLAFGQPTGKLIGKEQF
jgi:polar amino acid transport system permease protein